MHSVIGECVLILYVIVSGFVCIWRGPALNFQPEYASPLSSLVDEVCWSTVRVNVKLQSVISHLISLSLYYFSLSFLHPVNRRGCGGDDLMKAEQERLLLIGNKPLINFALIVSGREGRGERNGFESENFMRLIRHFLVSPSPNCMWALEDRCPHLIL